MLKIDAISASYGAATVLQGLSLQAQAGEILCILGRNGAGKTTLMKSIMGLVPISAGTMAWNGVEIGTLPPHDIARLGIGYVPQGRRLFGELTVAENLAVGLLARHGDAGVRARALALFPALQTRLDQRAETMSGGEQTMLAVARALCVDPDLMLLDEPTEGLQPSMVTAIRDVMVRLRDQGKAIVLVEQRIDAVLAVADRVAFVESGTVVETVDAAVLRADPDRLKARLGV